MIRSEEAGFSLWLLGVVLMAAGKVRRDLEDDRVDDHGGRGPPTIAESDRTALPPEERDEFETIELEGEDE